LDSEPAVAASNGTRLAGRSKRLSFFPSVGPGYAGADARVEF